MEAPSKSCLLDPQPTSVLKDILPEIMPFVANMCNASLQDGRLPVSQLTVKDGLKTAKAARAVMGKYSKPTSTVHHSAQFREFFEKTFGSCRPILCRFHMFNMLMFLFVIFPIKVADH